MKLKNIILVGIALATCTFVFQPRTRETATPSPFRHLASIDQTRAERPIGSFHRNAAEAAAWTVPYGKEFWHLPPAENRTVRMGSPSFDLGTVIERVTHAFAWHEAGRQSILEAAAYRVAIDAAAVRFWPHAPGSGQPDQNAEATIRLQAMRRGNAALYEPGNSQWSVLGNTVQELLDAEHGLLAHYEARAEEVEMSWILKQPPQGVGDVEINLSIDGLAYAGATPSGHHFADQNGVSRMRVGRVWVVDAAGKKVEAAMKVQSGQVQVLVAAAILQDLQYPIAIDPTLTAEFGVDEPAWSATPGRGQGWGWQGDPIAAWGSGVWLVVWRDELFGSQTDIYGARVNAAGELLDPIGIKINPPAEIRAAAPSAPAIAFDGQNFLVVWEEDGIYGARVSGAGDVLDLESIVVAAGPLVQREPEPPCEYCPCFFAPHIVDRPAVAWNGTTYLVLWQHVYAQSEAIEGVRVSAAGTILDAAPITISAGEERSHPAVAAAGETFLAVWQNSWDIVAARVNGTGAVLDPEGILISGTEAAERAPAVSSDGQNWLIAWAVTESESTSRGPSDVFARRLDKDGRQLDPAPIALGQFAAFDPVIAWNGENYLVAWSTDELTACGMRHGISYESSSVVGIRLSPNGEILDPEPLRFSTGRDYAVVPAVAAGGQDWLVAWCGYGPVYTQPNTIHCAVVGANGLKKGEDITAITTRRNGQGSPAVAFNGENYLVVWADDRPGFGAIYGARVAPNGDVLDPKAISISNLDQNYGCSLPAVTSSGGNYFVVWQANDGWPNWGLIFGARVSAAGEVLDPENIMIIQGPGASYYETFVRVTAGTSNYLVAYEQWGLLSASRVSFDGQVLPAQPGHVFGWPNSIQLGSGIPDLAAHGADFLVIGSDPSLNAYPVTAEGEALNPIALSDVSSGRAALATDGANYLVAWSKRVAENAYELHVARFSPAGALLSSATIDTDPTPHASLALAWNGRNYFLVWSSGPESSRNAFGIRLNVQGQPVDLGKFSLGENLSGLALAPGPMGECLLTYSIADSELGVPRLRARIMIDDGSAPPTDTIPPVLTCPADLVVHSLSEVPPPQFTGTVSDNSDPDPVVTHLSDTAVGENPIEITRLFQAVDVDGNTAFCSQRITVEFLPADVDHDGCVSRADMNVVTDQVRLRSTDLRYDANGDGVVNIADARFVAVHFTNPGGAACP